MAIFQLFEHNLRPVYYVTVLTIPCESSLLALQVGASPVISSDITTEIWLLIGDPLTTKETCY